MHAVTGDREQEARKLGSRRHGFWKSFGTNLDQREPESTGSAAISPDRFRPLSHSLDLAKPFDTQAVDRNHKSDKQRDPSRAVDRRVPETDDQRSRHNLVGRDDEVFAQVDEGRGEAKGGVDAAGRVARETFLGLRGLGLAQNGAAF